MAMKALQIIVLISASLALTGCNTLLYSDQNSRYSVEQYLTYKKTLNSLNSDELSKAHAQAATAYTSRPEADTRLYLALTLAQPDYSKTDLAAARDHLIAIVDNHQLADTTRLFAKVELEHVNRLIQHKQLHQQQATIIDELEDKVSTSERDNEKLTDKTKALQKELAEVKAKLRALADIEEDLSNKTESEDE